MTLSLFIDTTFIFYAICDLKLLENIIERYIIQQLEFHWSISVFILQKLLNYVRDSYIL